MFWLESRKVIKITGSNALAFLNRIVTADLEKLKQDEFLFSALLNSKSRFLYDFFIFLNGKDILIDLNKNCVDGFINTIKYYDLLDEYKITIDKDLYVFAEKGFLSNWNNGKFEGRLLSSTKKANYTNESLYNEERIKFCLPDGFCELIKEKSIILDYGYESTGAISFTKGCYIGQELITRTKRVGEIRKGLCCVEIISNLKILEETKEIKVLSTFGKCALLLMYKKDYANKIELNIDGNIFKIISKRI